MSDEASEGDVEETTGGTPPPAKRQKRKDAKPRPGFAPEVTQVEATQWVKKLKLLPLMIG